MVLSVEDRLAVHELVSLHGHLMDGGEFGKMDELLCAHVVYDLSANRLPRPGRTTRPPAHPHRIQPR